VPEHHERAAICYVGNLRVVRIRSASISKAQSLRSFLSLSCTELYRQTNGAMLYFGTCCLREKIAVHSLCAPLSMAIFFF
jgi:hypothetical protein